MRANDSVTNAVVLGSYIPLTEPWNSSSAIIGENQALMPRTIVFTALYVLYASALPGGASATIAFNINGVDQATLANSAVVGNQNVGTSGVLIAMQDDLVCLHVTAFAGAVPNITSIGIAYSRLPG